MAPACTIRLPFDELHEHAASRVRVKKRNVVSAGARAWLVVDQLDALLASALERGPDIGGRKRDMMNARALAVKIRRDWATVAGLK